jgi:hypothetical protein
MSTSPTLFDISSSSAATRLASPQHKIMDTKPRKLRTNSTNNPPNKNTNNTNNKKVGMDTATQQKSNRFHQAPWRVPGNFEIPDIIKEAWEKNKNKIIHHNQQNQSAQQQQQQSQKKRSIENEKLAKVSFYFILFYFK